MRRFLYAALTLALVAAPLDAHGGQYKGPADAGGPNAAQGGTAAPATNPSGAAAPGPGAPAQAPTAATAAPAIAYTRGAATRNIGQRSSTTGSNFEAESNYEVWEFWWENNKDRYLNLKQRLIKTTNVSGSLGVLTGRGRKTQASSSRRPSEQQINTDVIPTLKRLLAENDNRDIIDSSVLALGRVARNDMAGQVIGLATPLLQHNDLSVQSAATLSLGVLASPEGVPMCEELLANSNAGQQLVGGSSVHWLVRSFAALSLGLIGDETAAQALMDAAGSLPDADKDAKVSAIVGLALINEDNEKRADVIEFLGKMLKDRRMDVTVQSYIPTSLGKIGDPAATPMLLENFLDRDTNNLVRQSSAIGLGRLATTGDGDVIKALSDYVAEGRDMQTRHFCFISLAKIGANDEDGTQADPVHAGIVELFNREITKPSRQTNRSWAAIASAVYARAHSDAQPDVIDRLTAAYQKEKDPSYKGSFAIALGLLNAQAIGPELHDDFLQSKDDDFRGYAAVALGFLKYMDSADALRSKIRDKTTTPTFRLQTATGLGLMGDEQAISVLIDTLEGAQTLGVSSAVAKSLGLIGDRNAIAPLNNLALDSNRTDLTRAFAAVALGIVGEKTDLPFNAIISEDNNYRARVPAIDEVLDIL